MAGKRRRAWTASSPQFFAFVAEAAGLARSVAPAVADLLDPEGRTSEAPWSGDRERGLKLCVSMLAYLRSELVDGPEAARVDLAIADLRAEIEALSGERDVEP